MADGDKLEFWSIMWSTCAPAGALSRDRQTSELKPQDTESKDNDFVWILKLVCFMKIHGYAGDNNYEQKYELAA